MKRSVKFWLRGTALPLALLLGLSLSIVAPHSDAETLRPAAAATSPALNPKPITAATAAKLATLAPTEASLATTQAATTEPLSGEGNSFFRTTKGAFAIALLAGGLGYTVYSFSHDRVSSPQR